MAEFASGNLETLTFKLTYLCTVYLFLSCTGSAMFTRSTVGCLSPTKTPIKRTKIAPKDEQRREAGTNCAGINKRDNLMRACEELGLSTKANHVKLMDRVGIVGGWPFRTWQEFG